MEGYRISSSAHRCLLVLCLLGLVGCPTPPPQPLPPPPGTSDPFLYALSVSPNGSTTLVAISPKGTATPRGVVGTNFEGGLVYHPVQKKYYAFSRSASGHSTLHDIALTGSANVVVELGERFSGGLAYRYADKQLYAVTEDASGFSWLRRVSLDGQITPMFGLGKHFVGLTHDPAADLFYGVALDDTGFASIYRISMSGEVRRLFGIGMRVRGGIAFHPGIRRFYAIASDAAGASTLYVISLEGSVKAWSTVGTGFDRASLATAAEVPGAGIWIYLPWEDGRSVTGEPLYFDATVALASATNGYEFPSASALTWSSSMNGAPEGDPRSVTALAAGTHTIKVEGYGMTATRPIRVYANLLELHRSQPTRDELDYVMSNFETEWLDSADEKWSTYDGDPFDSTSTRPSKITSLALLYTLSLQKFSKPPPLLKSNERTLFDHVRTYTRKLQLRLDSGVSHASGGQISFGRVFSKWSDGLSDPVWNPIPYVIRLELVIHESRHNEPGDPGHSSCGGASLWTGAPSTPNAQDEQLENGSGYAAAAMYHMWVYKYGTDSAAIKQIAKDAAISLLKTRFCKKPTHSNPDVQAILNELLGP